MEKDDRVRGRKEREVESEKKGWKGGWWRHGKNGEHKDKKT